MAEPITNVLGTVAIKHCGEYDATMHYEKLNVVTYNGSSYCAKDNTIGNLPTNTTYWDLMAEKGDKGDKGDTPVKGTDYYTAADKAELESTLSSDVSDEVTDQLSTLTSATPIVVSSASGMTDTTRIYVLSTDGHWYWYNGTNWIDGGVYQARTIENGSIVKSMLNDSLLNILMHTRTPQISAGADLNTFTDVGYYFLMSGSYTNCYKSSITHSILKVERVYTSQGSYIIKQTITSRSNTKENYSRTLYGNLSNLTATNWNLESKGNYILEAQPYLGYSTDLNTILTPGFYMGLGGNLTQNAPYESFPTYHLAVSYCYTSSGVYAENSRIIQQIITERNTNKMYVRCIYGLATQTVDEYTFNDWTPLTDFSNKPNKNIITLGDSILGKTPHLVTDKIQEYFSGEVYNCNFGGTTAVHRTGHYLVDFSFYDLVNAIEAEDFSVQETAIQEHSSIPGYFPNTLNTLKNVDWNTIDICCIMYGTNDFASNYAFGNNTDENSNTTLGALHYGIKKLSTLYPNVKFVILTPIFRIFNNSADDNSNVHLNTNNNTLKELVDAEISFAKSINIPHINLYEIGINIFNYSNWLSDGVHLTSSGRNMIGDKIGEHLKQV